MKGSSRISLIASLSLLAAGCTDGPTTPADIDCHLVPIGDANSERCDPVDGTITAIVVDDSDGSPVFLVEEQPDEPDEGQKMFFHLSQQTEIFVELRSGLMVPGTTADLDVGTRVRAWKGPIVTLSYPGGTTTPRIEVVR